MATNQIGLPKGFTLDQPTGLPEGFTIDAGFDPEGEDYDYESAIKAGLKPKPVEGDDVPHWPSRDPKTGLLLKGRKHKTWDLLEQGEKEAGYKIYKKDGRYYSKEIDNLQLSKADSFGYGVNRGIARFAGGFVDLMNEMVNAKSPIEWAYEGARQAYNIAGKARRAVFGDTFIEDMFPEKLPEYPKLKVPQHAKPIGGSQHLLETGENIGLLRSPDETQHQGFMRAGEVFGEVIPSMMIPAMWEKAAMRLGFSTPRFMQPIIEAFKTAPVKTALTELHSTAGAAAGAGLGEEYFPDSKATQLSLEFAGGFFAPPKLVLWAARQGKSLGGSTVKAIKTLTPGGRINAAAKEIVRHMETDPNKAVETIVTGSKHLISGHDLTPAQLLGDKFLMRLEKSMSKSHMAVEEGLMTKEMKTQDAIQEYFKGLKGVDPSEANTFLRMRLRSIEEAVSKITEKAILRANSQRRRLPYDVSVEKVSKVVANEIDKAEKIARNTERKLWDKVNLEAPTTTESTYTYYDTLKANLQKADDMPAIIERMLGKGSKSKLLDNEPLSQLKAFRTKLLKEIREEYANPAGPDRNKVRMLEGMEESVLKDMVNSDAGNALDEAREFSFQINKRFRQGIIGQIARRERAGGMRIEDAEILTKSIKGGPEGGVNLEELVDAAGDDLVALDGVKDYIKRIFVMQATDANTRVVPGSTETFLRNHSDLLDRLPDLRDQFRNAAKAQKLADETIKYADRATKSLANKRKSVLALYLGSNPERRIRSVMNSPQPMKNMKALIGHVKADKTGLAFKGFKADFMDEIFRRGVVKRRGVEYVSGTKMGEWMKKNWQMTHTVLSPKEIDNMNKIVNTAKKLENQLLSSRNVEDILGDAPDLLSDFMMRIIGANMGTLAPGGSGASILQAHAGSRMLRRIGLRMPIYRTRDVIAEALLDKNKMLQLLNKARTPVQLRELKRKLNLWLVDIVPEVAEEREPE